MSIEKEIVKLTQRKGLEKDLPILDEAEFGFSTDTQNIYIGSKIGNILLPTEEDLNSLREQLTQLAAGNKTELLNLIEEAVRGGLDGHSAYQIAVENGFVGNETEWLLSLKGEPGAQGGRGEDGYTPVKGVDYFDGQDGYTPIKGVDYFDGVDGQKGDPFTYDDFTPEQLENLLTVKRIDEIDIPIPRFIGYYASSSGILNLPGTNGFNGLWRTIEKVPNNGETTYKLIYTHDEAKPVVRLLSWSNGTYTPTRLVFVNDEFVIPENITEFAINFGVVGALPNTNPPLQPLFSSAEAIENVRLVRIGEVNESIVTNTHLERRLEEFNKSNKVLKILMLGNSFSLDALFHLKGMADSAGIKVVLGIAYESNGTLSGMWDKIQNNTPISTYHKWDEAGYVILSGRTLRNIAEDEDWDIITYQQVSSSSGNYTSFQPFLNNIHNYVKGIARNPNVKYGLHMTWAFANGSQNLINSPYETQIEMYDAIKVAYLEAMREMNFDILIPNGTAIQNGRATPYLQDVGTDLTRDGFHLNEGMGRYLAALTVFESILSPYYKKDIMSDVSYAPINTTNFLIYLAKKTAKNAVLNPFNTANITPHPYGGADFIQKSPQLYNHTPSSYTKDVRLDATNGTVYAATNFYTTDFIEVEPNRTIVFGSSPYDTTYMGLNSTAIYDKDKNFISHIPAATTSFVTPPNARYIRKTTNGLIGRLGIFYDEVSTDFTYWRKIDPSLGVSESDHAKIADRATVADSATSALTANVALRAETVENIARVVSKQKFNIDTVLTNHRLSGSAQNGIPTPMQGFNTSDFIPIEEGTTNIIIAKNFSAGSVNYNNIAYYTEDKTFISGFNTGSTPVDEYGRLNLIPPANAKFMRYCVQGVYQRIGIFFNEYSYNFNYYEYYEFDKSKWFGKKVVGYGDSLVAGASNATTSWLGMLAKQFGFEPINRGIGGSTVLQSDTERIAWVADGINKTLGEYGEYVSRPLSLNDGSGQTTGNTQPEGTVEILSSMCTDARVNTIPTDADAIIILAGTNGMDEASYRLMLQKIYTRCPQAIVFCCSNTFRYSDTARTQIVDVSVNNTIIQKLCQEFGSHFIDLKGKEGVNHYNQTIYLSDLVHATPAGNERRAMVISSVLK